MAEVWAGFWNRGLILLLAAAVAGRWEAVVYAQPASAIHETKSDILYRNGENVSAEMQERCRLDVHYPAGGKELPVVVWFHGGGLMGGSKSIPAGLANKGVVVLAANYRLSPKHQAPAYLEDAAAAVAWAFANCETYGGSPKLIFVSGHSAGGYLTSMLGLDKRWLAAHQIDADRLAGLAPLSGQAITHSTIRAERKLPAHRPHIDDLAPLFHVRKDAPPLLIVTGDREKELRGRYEENAYFWRMLKLVGHAELQLHELPGYDHGGMAAPAFPLVLKFIADRQRALQAAAAER